MLVFAFLVASCSPAGEETRVPSIGDAVTAAERLYVLALADPSPWDGEKVNRIGRAMPGLPAEIACRILWFTASVPSRIDDVTIYTAALQSQSETVRKHAAALMLAKGGEDNRRMLMGAVASPDAGLAEYILEGIAQRHITEAAPELIQVLFHPHVIPQVKETAAQHLRRLTGANLRADPLVWREWWDENRHLF
jgi:hypothetical protein